MAVTFKVPSSPKRNIEATDNFLGTDFTNTGVSMEIYRSPNAPNMIRDVPGKVRKRMGYYKEVFFGRNTNINFAWGTSGVEKEVRIDETGTRYKVYDLIKPMKSESGTHTAYIELDVKCEEIFYIYIKGEEAWADVLVEIIEGEENRWVHKSVTFDIYDGEELNEVYFWSPYLQSIYIKNFSIMMNKDENYEWSPAPKYFVERETTDPVYGCHFLKNNVDKGVRVTNVNRVLDTSDTYKSFSVPPHGAGTNLSKVKAFKFAEIPCQLQTIYYEYDYELTVSSGETGRISFISFSNLEPTSGTPVHISGTRRGFYEDDLYIDAYDTIGDATLKIKNLSVMYDKDENYEWSKAPEDTKDTFPLKDMYTVYPEELATIENRTIDIAAFSGSHTEWITIGSPFEHGKPQHVAFDITTTVENANAVLGGIEMQVAGSNTWIYTTTENYNKKHIELYAGSAADNQYIASIGITFTLSSGSSKATISLSGITLKRFDVRDTYTVSDKWFLYHTGKQFYLRANESDEFISVYEEANEHKSSSFQINDKSYIIDGKDVYEFSIDNGAQVNVLNEENAYIPLVTFAKEPDGGGTAKDPLNLIQPGFYEQFIGRAGKTEYQLSFDGLDSTECKAWVLDANSNWNLKREGTDFTVDRRAGKIKFTTAPGETPIQGEDSVKILAYRTVEGYRSRITKCKFGVLFGVSGACDRIFLSGNPDHPNWDFYSGFNDATYYPDTGYSVLGSAQSAITGYAIVSSYLATFKDGFDMSQSVFIREGDMLENEETGTSEAVFKLINTLQGEGAIAPYSFGYLQTEPLFLTNAGIYAITEQDITGEKYSQNRSFYLDGKLRKEDNLKTAIATVYDNQYVLALNNELYILDGLQATRTDRSEPYATRQYAGFYCTDIPATCLWTDDQICFGTSDGRICRFYSDEKALESYNDDGKPIYACWETPDLDDQLFYKNKTYRYFAVRLMQSLKTTATLYSRKLGVWTKIADKMIISNPIDFEDFDFDLFTFSIDDTEKLIHSKVRVKKVDKARFKIENNEINEPFGLSDLAVEYIQSGNYKG